MWATSDKSSHCACRRPERDIAPTLNFMMEGRARCAWDWEVRDVSKMMVGKGIYPGLTEMTGHCFGLDPC